ncbi:MAG: serine/threonine-protein kinase [Nannocystaceae bacterium]
MAEAPIGPCPGDTALFELAEGLGGAEAEAHVDRCPRCRAQIAALVALRSSIAPSPPSDAPIDPPPSTPSPAPTLASGATIGDLVVGEVIGAGGMGTVYLAHDRRLDRPVALKILRAGGASPEGRATLLAEARALARLAHPNVVTVHEVGERDGAVYLVMERIEGLTLGRWLAASPRAWPEILAALRQAGEGLAAAHRAGVVHRDIKPSNLIVGVDGRVRVIDFGLASVAGGGATGERWIAGTPAYMAPEQRRGAPPDVRSDLYAFGVVIHEALLGRRPAELVDAARERAIPAGVDAKGDFARSVEDRARPRPGPPKVDAKGDLAHCPQWLRALLRRLLAEDPAARPASVDEVVAALDAGPRGIRRRRLGLGLALGLAGVGVGVALLRAPTPLCGDVEAIDSVWGDARRERLRARIDALAPGPGAPTPALVEALDARAGAWRSTHAELCDAAAPADAEAAAEQAATITCLDRRLAELVDVILWIDRAAPSRLALAPRLVAELRPVAVCRDPTAAAGEAPLPRRRRSGPRSPTSAPGSSRPASSTSPADGVRLDPRGGAPRGGPRERPADRRRRGGAHPRRGR